MNVLSVPVPFEKSELVITLLLTVVSQIAPFEKVESTILVVSISLFESAVSNIVPFENEVVTIVLFEIKASSRISSSIVIFVRIKLLAVPPSMVTLLKNESSMVELVKMLLLPVELFNAPKSTIVFVNTLLLPVPFEKSEVVIATLDTSVPTIVPPSKEVSVIAVESIVPPLNVLLFITLSSMVELKILTPVTDPPVMEILSKTSYWIACSNSFRVIFLVPSSPCMRLTITKRSSERVLAPLIGSSSEIFDIR